jgi:hypothetical protein
VFVIGIPSLQVCHSIGRSRKVESLFLPNPIDHYDIGSPSVKDTTPSAFLLDWAWRSKKGRISKANDLACKSTQIPDEPKNGINTKEFG